MRPVQQDVDHRQAGAGAPVAEQPRLDVLERERLAQQGVVLQVDLADREVVGRGPPAQVEGEVVRRRTSDVVPRGGGRRFVVGHGDHGTTPGCRRPLLSHRGCAVGRGARSAAGATKVSWREAWRIATTRPADQPGARPPGGGVMVVRSCPLRASSQEMSELEFHMSPVRCSSAPQVRRGSPGAARGSVALGRRRGSCAAGCRRPRRRPGSVRRASTEPRSGRAWSGRVRAARRDLPLPRPAGGRGCSTPAPSR